MKYDTSITLHFTPYEIAYLQYVLAHFDSNEIDMNICYIPIHENLCDDFSNIIMDFTVPVGFPKKEEDEKK